MSDTPKTTAPVYASPLAVAIDKFLTRRRIDPRTEEGIAELAAFISGWNAALEVTNDGR